MDDATFDVILVGTGLTESITAAALAKAGFKVAHIDSNSYYGGAEASLSLDELAAWADAASAARSSALPASSRHYAICLRPSVIPSVGPLISSLVASGVARYGGFRLLERVAVYHPSGVLKPVPATKEDVFKSKDISLLDKRRLMRFLMFAAGEFEGKKELEDVQETPFAEFLTKVFSLTGEIHTALVYALALCSSPSDPTLPALHRIRRYLRSTGRYGPSPFLVGHYGGTGEIAQGFCRAAAVSGGVYILGRKILSISHSDSESDSPHYSITLNDFPDTLTASVLISSAAHLPPDLEHLATFLPDSSLGESADPTSTDPATSIARCIAILDRGIIFPPASPPQDQEQPESTQDDAEDASNPPQPPTQTAPLDAAILVFPPASVPGGSANTAATVLVTGEGTMSTPKDRWILYIALPLHDARSATGSAEDHLRPYLDATLALTVPSQSSRSLSSPAASSEPTTPSEPAPTPLFTAFYIEQPTPHPSPPQPHAHPPTSPSLAKQKTHIIPAPLAPSAALPDAPDAAAVHAEAAFWGAVRALRGLGVGQKDAEVEVESFWPPLEVESGGEEEW